MAGRGGAAKLSRLRELMKAVAVDSGKKKGIEAYIVSSVDAHQSEYLADRDQRRRFISGFGGSAGTAIITLDRALLWTDGRYFTQALAEFDPIEAWTLMKEGVIGTPTQASWLVSNLPPKSTVAADPTVLSYSVWAPLQASLEAAGHNLLPLEENLVDQVWGENRPKGPSSEIVAQPLKFSGWESRGKVDSCREAMRANGVATLVVTALDEVAYLLNLRGRDIPYNPVFFAYVILTLEDLHFFVDKSKLSQEAEQQLRNEKLDPVYHPYEEVRSFLRARVSATASEGKVWISDGSSNALHIDCGSAGKHTDVTPISVMKAIKNSVEIEGMKKAHIRDAVALVKYFAWLEDKVKNKRDEGPVTEVSGSARLEEFRREQDDFIGPSFDTISSVGAHGAVIHYTPSPATDFVITDQDLYLCDSGGQYRDGTTDVTRTLHFGVATPYERECFTRVFKGQCALATTIFPSMTKGNYLDTLARKSLWEVGLDYLHGTGHGVGAYLNVHEGPIGISWRPYPHDPGLQPGMFLSNEPGYYEDGKFGIRLENIEVVVNATTPYNHNSRGFLTFETVTLVPIQTNLLDLSLLNDQEITYLNRYHAKCLEELRPLLQGPENVQALHWLERETRPVAR